MAVARSENLNLYLPVNGDTQDISQISWNFDTLDSEVLTRSAQTLTTSQKTQVKTNLGLGSVDAMAAAVYSAESLGSFSTLSGLGTILDGCIAGMNANGFKVFSVSASADVGMFSNGGTYRGYAFKGGSSSSAPAYAHVMFYGSNDIRPISGRKNTNGWEFRKEFSGEQITGSSADLNNYTSPGIFYSSNVTTTNKPSGLSSNYYHLMVVSWVTAVIQVIWGLGGNCWMRGYYSNSWTGWMNVATGSTAATSLTMDSNNTSAGTVKMWKYGQTITVTGSVTPSVSGSTGWKTITSLSAAPEAEFYFNTNRGILGRITTGGNIQLYSPDDTIQYFNATYARGY